MSNPEWVAVDWGTTHLRLWLMSAQGDVLERLDNAQGMGALAPVEFEQVLTGLIGDRLSGVTPVVVCGMAGARQGWQEAPYVPVPCVPPGARDAIRVTTADPRLDVYILPGLSQAQPADVMRGEETQIGGFISQEPDFDGVLCLPGTHCKWAHISAREVVSFRTFMTGELFSLLGTQSVLRHSVSDGWDADAFETAVNDAMARPAGIGAELFSIRAAGLVHDQSPDVARARLSGLLIGLELAAARPYWLGQEVVVLGADGLSDIYLNALKTQSVWCRAASGEDTVLNGLKAAYAQLKADT
ncbi:2-dehydro-3-deoxygalactonokinase [Tropicibacter naphthalenivorans]|uniref:2-keto-3-deoxy-galactonokinase n=1 Tax=Tropicibacter naphthalenivorans TaxID=441103 RepID=A0A0P1GCN7_9RHOB|nr:2-dehydro-3-deoxygalactonokinase [Tropicibacter naphthalenivorans]CUH79078.1 2-keto-3-deoxy-galactonokinase [Tropicibacter naphthalenivorans]SMD03591.1 2-dehydro-3-deoxygalactonokinase [Tropicibacter naphthalenivorans]